jgi:hypothetical protein
MISYQKFNELDLVLAALSIVHCQMMVVPRLVYAMRGWYSRGRPMSRPRHNRVLARAAMAKASSSNCNNAKIAVTEFDL